MQQAITHTATLSPPSPAPPLIPRPALMSFRIVDARLPHRLSRAGAAGTQANGVACTVSQQCLSGSCDLRSESKNVGTCQTAPNECGIGTGTKENGEGCTGGENCKSKVCDTQTNSPTYQTCIDAPSIKSDGTACREGIEVRVKSLSRVTSSNQSV